jgi:aspartate 1-decarboxylase
LKATDIGVHELVQVVNIDNGARFKSYTIAGTPGVEVIANGAAARLVQRGDKIIIITHALVARQ